MVARSAPQPASVAAVAVPVAEQRPVAVVTPAVRKIPTAPARGDVIGALAAAALRDPPPARPVKVAADNVARGRRAEPDRHAEADHQVEEGRWGIQIGAYRAQALAQRAMHKAAKLRLTRGKPQQIVTSRSERNPVYLARLVHFTPKAARAACAALHHKGISCEVVRPDELRYANR